MEGPILRGACSDDLFRWRKRLYLSLADRQGYSDGMPALLAVIRDWETEKRVGVYLVGPMLCLAEFVTSGF